MSRRSAPGPITASDSAWTDKSMLEEGHFYPYKTMSAEERLWWYSRFFDTRPRRLNSRFSHIACKTFRACSIRRPAASTWVCAAWMKLRDASIERRDGATTSSGSGSVAILVREQMHHKCPPHRREESCPIDRVACRRRAWKSTIIPSGATCRKPHLRGRGDGRTGDRAKGGRPARIRIGITAVVS